MPKLQFSGVVIHLSQFHNLSRNSGNVDRTLERDDRFFPLKNPIYIIVLQKVATAFSVAPVMFRITLTQIVTLCYF